MKKFIILNVWSFFRFSIISILLLLINGMFIIANAKIVSSVKPIGFIAEAIASGVTDTDILLPDGASPHTYFLKPSDLVKLKSAQLVIWVGEDIETFLPTILKDIDKKKQIELMQLPQVKAFLRVEQKHNESKFHHENNHKDHFHNSEYDEHIWLSPKIAKIIAQAIHNKLIIQYPNKRAIIDENLSKFTTKLIETEQNIAKKLINVQNKGYFVFHDAYGYFESQFGLKNLGSFIINPAVQPGVQKIYAIQQKLKEHQAVCVFKEPQFNSAVIEKLVDGTDVHIGVLNPLGTDIIPSKDSYSQFLLQLTQQFLDCLDNK